MAVSRDKKSATVDPGPRHVWLASLGLLVAARRESGRLAQRVLGDAAAVAARLRKSARRAESDLRGGIQGVRRQVQPKVVQFSSEVEARLAPVLDKLGLKAETGVSVRKVSKPAPRTSVRRSVRQPAKRVAKKAAH